MSVKLAFLILFSMLQGIVCAKQRTLYIEHAGQQLEAELTLINLRGEHVSLSFQDESGKIFPYQEELPAPKTYIGKIRTDGFSDALISGAFQEDDTFDGSLNLNRGIEYPIKASKTLMHKVRGLNYVPIYDLPTEGTLEAGDIEHGVFFENAIDVRYFYMNKYGFTSVDEIPRMLEAIETQMVQMTAVFLRDMKFKPLLGPMLFRLSKTHCPYEPCAHSSSKLKPEVMRQWPSPDHRWDYFSGLVGGGNSLDLYNVTTPHHFIWRHELCHTIRRWSVPIDGPADCAEGATIMGRNFYGTPAHLGRFGATTVKKMWMNRFADPGRFTMDQKVLDTIPFPPYAAADYVRISRNNPQGEVRIEALLNDFDANNDALSLVDCDSTSARGSVIERVGDQIRYTINPSTIGLDYFYYDIKDASGQTAKGLVLLDLQNEFKIYQAEEAQSLPHHFDRRAFSTGSGNIQWVEPADFVEFNVQVDKAGPHTLKVRHSSICKIPLSTLTALPSEDTYRLRESNVSTFDTDQRYVNTLVNGKKVGMRRLPHTFTQALWHETNLGTFVLKQGDNRIRLEPAKGFFDIEGSGIVNIDALLVAKGLDVRINFGPTGLVNKLGESVHEYYKDSGLLFGENDSGQRHGLKYGWNKDLTKNGGKTSTHHSGKSSYGQLHAASYVNMDPDSTWEIALNNGAYHVYVFCGSEDGINHIQIEDQQLRDNNGLKNHNVYEADVLVTDGRLTISPAKGSTTPSLCFLWINDLP